MLNGLEQICENVRQGLDGQNRAREQAFGLSRQVIRAASIAIKCTCTVSISIGRP